MSAAVQGATPIVVNWIAGKTGVPVRWVDNFGTAATDGKAVYMPRMPLDAPYFATRAYGYAIHEAAHLKYTSFEAHSGLDRRVHWFANAIEDGRIEQLVCADFLGARAFLQDLTEELFGDRPHLVSCEPITDLDDAFGRLVYCEVGVRRMAYPQMAEAVPYLREQMEQLLQPPEREQLSELVDRACTATSTAQVRDVALALVALLDQVRDAQASVDLGQDEKSQDEAEGQPEDAGQDDESTGEADDQADGQAQDQAEDEADQQPQSPSQACAPDSESGDRSDECEAEPDVDGKAQEDEAEGANDLEAQSIWDLPSDRGDMVRGELQEAIGELQAQQGDSLRGVPPTRMYGYPSVEVPRANDVSPLFINDAKAQSMAVRTAFEDALQGEMRRPIGRAYSGSRLVRTAATRLQRGSTKVFRRQELRESSAAHVVLLVDSSGSMSGAPMELASQAALTVALALEEVADVRCTVATFWGDTEATVGVIKAAEQTVRQRAGAFTVTAGGGTPTADALLYALGVLEGEAEGTRRIVIVMTDGAPDCLESTKDVIGRADADIQIAAIGMQCDVSHLCASSVRVDNLAGLAGQTMQLVQEHLLAA